jgi:hypothetical protein
VADQEVVEITRMLELALRVHIPNMGSHMCPPILTTLKCIFHTPWLLQCFPVLEEAMLGID